MVERQRKFELVMRENMIRLKTEQIKVVKVMECRKVGYDDKARIECSETATLRKCGSGIVDRRRGGAMMSTPSRRASREQSKELGCRTTNRQRAHPRTKLDASKARLFDAGKIQELGRCDAKRKSGEEIDCKID